MDYFIAFADILGTTDRVNRGIFDDIEILDFANPVGIIAEFNTNIQFSVFSDSVFIAAPKDEVDNFVSIISFLYSQWFSDAILVRSGISYGELRFVEHGVADEIFKKLSNLSYSRVYGKGLIAAHSVESKSGPGALCYVDEIASGLLKSKNSNYILEGSVDTLVWADARGIEYWSHIFEKRVKQNGLHLTEKRHYYATADYFSRLALSGKQLPDRYLYKTMADSVDEKSR
ncbi:MAG TPA: hypothetical protein ENJ28_01730 [Gammaproteobacteria bacterium]|nr:hypothetical protein [Gammaproteobacteria bacterium]